MPTMQDWFVKAWTLVEDRIGTGLNSAQRDVVIRFGRSLSDWTAAAPEPFTLVHLPHCASKRRCQATVSQRDRTDGSVARPAPRVPGSLTAPNALIRRRGRVSEYRARVSRSLLDRRVGCCRAGQRTSARRVAMACQLWVAARSL